MSRRKRRFDRPLADSLGPDDGIDPRDWDRGQGSRPVRNRKAQQLCRQVEHALLFALAGLADPALREADVLRVQPFPDSGRLLVTVASDGALELVEKRLAAAAARLRTDVASAIHRRKTPEFVFQVVRKLT
jgi:ribosome-binding factor A